MGVSRTKNDLKAFLRAVLKYGLPSHVIQFGEALGDDLLCTAVARELKRRGARRLWMMSNHKILFQGNRDIDAVVDGNQAYLRIARRFLARTMSLSYHTHDFTNDTSAPLQNHIITSLCMNAGLRGPIDLRPWLTLSTCENSNGRRADRQIAIQSSIASARFPMLNKEWDPVRFQEVVEVLSERFNFVQIGSPSDPAMRGAIDLRGKTSIRETAAIIKRSIFFIGLEGFLAHLARAVDTRAVVVYGGRSSPLKTGYPCNENVVNQPECSPCLRWSACDFGHRCMKDIHPQHVIAAVDRLVSRLASPLEMATETV